MDGRATPFLFGGAQLHMWDHKKEPPVFEVPKQLQTCRRIAFISSILPAPCWKRKRARSGREVAPRALPESGGRRSGCVWDDPCSAHLHLPPRPTKSGSLHSLRWLLFFFEDLKGTWV